MATGTPAGPSTLRTWHRATSKLRAHFHRCLTPHLKPLAYLASPTHHPNVSVTTRSRDCHTRGAGLSYNQANIAFYSFQDGTPTRDGTPSELTPGGAKGPFSDGYFYSHLQVDAQGSVRLKRGFTFVMYGLNLTNEVFGFYQGSSQFMIQREYYGPTIAAGFRWSPSFEK